MTNLGSLVESTFMLMSQNNDFKVCWIKILQSHTDGAITITIMRGVVKLERIGNHCRIVEMNAN